MLGGKQISLWNSWHWIFSVEFIDYSYPNFERFSLFQNAQHVEVESIPLPDMPHAPSNILIQDIPLPGAQPPSILKKTSAYG